MLEKVDRTKVTPTGSRLSSYASLCVKSRVRRKTRIFRSLTSALSRVLHRLTTAQNGSIRL
jgi:hypothetical protein